MTKKFYANNNQLLKTVYFIRLNNVKDEINMLKIKHNII